MTQSLKHLPLHPQVSFLSRRQWLKIVTPATAGLAVGMGAPHLKLRGAPPKATILDRKIVSHENQLYHGWPTLTRTQQGQLIAVWSGGRQEHVCPFGRVEMMRSHDGGETWTWPRVLLDSGIDDRDAGVLETRKGTLLVTTFSSLAYESGLRGARKEDSAWNAAHNRLNAEQRQSELGQWMLRSTDGGVTWSKRYSSIVNSPHGPIQLSDGRLLYAGKELWTGQKSVGVCESNDDGKSWKWLSTIPLREGDQMKNYHELHAVETKDQRIIVQIRNHNPQNNRETLQCESDDGGRTWSTPKAIGVWGLPSHLLKLRDGRLLMTYGYRRSPFGNQARISEDHGRTWSEPMTLSNDGIGGDLGYPSTVELDDGTLVSIWYERMKSSPRAVLRQARWKL